MTVTCIIPAYNEAARIGAVLEVVRGHPDVAEVIVVDDGSTDGTPDVVRGFDGVTLIEQHVNGGKTRALLAGIDAAQSDLVMFIDADLSGLTRDGISELIAPVANGEADMTISLRGNAPRLWQWIGLDYISGERVLRKDFVTPHMNSFLALPKFGFEVFLNRLALEQSARIAVVHWPDVKSPYKADKFGLISGLRADAAMVLDMCRSVPPVKLLSQIVQMRQARVPVSAT